MAFMGFEETVDQVAKLLPLMPGVEVIDVYECDPEGAKFTLVIHSQESLVRLALITIASNSELAVSVAKPGNWYQGPEDLRYVLVAMDDPGSLTEPFLPPTILQKVGIYLARDLKAARLLDPAEADRLQRAWNAVPM
jgi:hypothetical protein